MPEASTGTALVHSAPTELPDTGVAAVEEGAAPAAGAPRRLAGLAVIATAQLMLALDLTIVNVALPHIQAAVGFSGSNLEWVINAYAVAFGALLLLGGRSGDLLERRRILHRRPACLRSGLAARRVRHRPGVADHRPRRGARRPAGGDGRTHRAVADRCHLPPRDDRATRAVAVYSAMFILGQVVGLLVGGLLVAYASWRWVFFVNVPIGLVVASLATRVLPQTGRRLAGRFDLPGAITATAGVAALVYGLSNAATTPDGISHWGDTKVVVSLAAAGVLLAAFAVIETRQQLPAVAHEAAAQPGDRAGAFGISLCVGTAILGMFFFLTLFIQDVWGYSALRTGLAYLPYVPAILVTTVVAQWLVRRIGARPLLILGSTLAAGGMVWLSRITEHSSYAGGMLGPALLLGAGLGLVFVPMSLVILNKVNHGDAGAASSLVNVGQQVGGSIGLAVVGTVAWSAVARALTSQAKTAARARVHATTGTRAAAAGGSDVPSHALCSWVLAGATWSRPASLRVRCDHRISRDPGQAPGLIGRSDPMSEPAGQRSPHRAPASRERPCRTWRKPYDGFLPRRLARSTGSKTVPGRYRFTRPANAPDLQLRGSNRCRERKSRCRKRIQRVGCQDHGRSPVR